MQNLLQVLSTIFQSGALNLIQLLTSEFCINILLLGIMQWACYASLSPQKRGASCPVKGFRKKKKIPCIELSFLFLSQHAVKLPNRHSLGELLPAARGRAVHITDPRPAPHGRLLLLRGGSLGLRVWGVSSQGNSGVWSSVPEGTWVLHKDRNKWEAFL